MSFSLPIECKVWRNPLNLLRGGEYQRFTSSTGKDPLTYYDMNLSAQDHQTYFTCEADAGKQDYESKCKPTLKWRKVNKTNLCFPLVMATAWRERNPAARVSAAKEALILNPECAPALLLLAEEDASTVSEAEQLLKQALKAAEASYRKSQQNQHQGSLAEGLHRKIIFIFIVTNSLILIWYFRAGYQRFDLCKTTPCDVCKEARQIEGSRENVSRCRQFPLFAKLSFSKM